jgi:hypothetical protein
LVDAVHEGYLAGLSLVRISLVTQPPLRPGWRRYKCTNTEKVVYRMNGYNFLTLGQQEALDAKVILTEMEVVTTPGWVMMQR